MMTLVVATIVCMVACLLHVILGGLVESIVLEVKKDGV